MKCRKSRVVGNCGRLSQRFAAARSSIAALRALQFEPLQETYATLANFEVVVSEEEQKMLQDLGQIGEDFKVVLQEVDQVRGRRLSSAD